MGDRSNAKECICQTLGSRLQFLITQICCVLRVLVCLCVSDIILLELQGTSCGMRSGTCR